MAPLRLAVLLSGSGSNLQALIDAQARGELQAELAVVLSDRADAYGLQRALLHQLPAVSLPLPRAVAPGQRAAVRANWERRLTAVLEAFDPDLLVLAGFMRVLSPALLDHFPNRVINQHPALLPEDGGDTVTTSSGLVIPALRGAHVVAEALRHGLPVTGCTVHRVTPAVDDGPVLARAEVPVLPGDDVQRLHERIKVVERRMVVQVINQLATDLA